jgi:RHH-type proline utilization regulon transcriptional repressor/proline dehydrogenase/delta 1-pyrroline-5-carboxylate dehydrogenase
MKFLGDFSMLDSLNTLSTREKDELKLSVPQLAAKIQDLANHKIHWGEKLQSEEFARMVQDPHGRAVFMAITDQVFRLRKDSSILKKFIQILRQHGVPEFFNSLDRTALTVLKNFGPLIPKFLCPPIVWIILNVMRHKTRKVILPGDYESLRQYFRNCQKENYKINLNHLGDMVLGEKEAQKHLDDYIKGLRNPNVTCISVKISTLYSQTDSVAHENTVSEVLSRLLKLIYVANDETQNSGINKLVYLDMEEYKDLSLTVDVFKCFLQNPDLIDFSLGIVLQAYIPDSFSYQQEITRLAKMRLAKGGVPIRIRIVKGANMEMEKVISSTNNWTQAPFTTKLETDANFKRMVAYAFQEENLKAVKIGIGSHNIFEIAFASALQNIRGLDAASFEFEMLEGIANHTRRSIQSLLGPVLVYSPVAGKEEFLNAIAYLVRRLIENTDPENFLSHSFNLKVGTQAWNDEENKFLSSVDHINHLDPPHPNHKQDRKVNLEGKSENHDDIENFLPDSPTNFALPANQVWLENEIFKNESRGEELIPLKVAGEKVKEERRLLTCRDLSQPDQILSQFQAANSEDITRAIRYSVDAVKEDWDKDEDYRHKITGIVAEKINKNRGSLIKDAMDSVGKRIEDLDAEVSEAIDFIKYYSGAMKYFRENFPQISFSRKGVVLVISPWNFPIAIPTGGIAAALATGNRVIIKPSPYSLLATWNVVKLFWEAGVPKSALQFIPCHDDNAHLLTQHPDIAHVIFTGSAGTADKILKARPDLDFSGETSGKNIFIITDSADKELAIKHLVESAFGYNGQKCSASSIAILTKEVYADQKFRRQLKDAVESLPVGILKSKPQNKITPLITTPKKDLLRAMTTLEPGEQWLVKPEQHDIDNIWSPGVKWNVPSGGFTHLTEFFGPLLGIMPAKNLKHACRLANQTEYGLTSGLHSLDDGEIEYFMETIQAGNLYVNNKTTGAIVGRQPFGGIKNSRRGAGGKAGGINYILQFMKIAENNNPMPPTDPSSSLPRDLLIHQWKKTDWASEQDFFELASEIPSVIQGAKSCHFHYDNYFSKEQSSAKCQQVLGQKNIFRYRKVGSFTIRAHPKDSASDILMRLLAGTIAGNHVSVSIPGDMGTDKIVLFLNSQYLQPIHESFSVDIETDDELCKKILSKQIDRLAYTNLHIVPDQVYKAAVQVNLPIFRQKPIAEGRFLLLEQCDEQCVSYTYHRYGNSGLKQFEGETI